MNSIDEKIEKNANEAALLNVLIYLNIEDVGVGNGRQVGDIVEKLKKLYGTSEDGDSTQEYKRYVECRKENANELDYKDRKRQYDMLVNACKSNPHFASMTIDSQSRLMKPGYDEGGLTACTFTDTAGNVMFVYRGTGSGEWLDNAEGISGLEASTEQQREALEYFERVVKEAQYDIKKPHIDICGHSKGGNKSQFVTINSAYNYLIEHCYNFDGQGMSPEAIEAFKKAKGEKAFQEAAEKMYGFYAENDYVNPLGVPVVPEDHRVYLKSVIDLLGIVDNKKYHYADDYLNLDGTFSEPTTQGDLSKLVQNLSEQTAHLPPALRSNVAHFMMAIIQGSKKPINGDHVTLTDYVVGGEISLSLILANLKLTADGRAVVDDLGVDLLETAKYKLGEKLPENIKYIFGAYAELDVAIILAALSPSLFADDLRRVISSDLKALAGIALENLKILGDYAIDKLKQFENKIMDTAEDVRNAYSRFVAGARASWGKLQVSMAGLVQELIKKGNALSAAIDELKNKLLAAVTRFFTSLVEKARGFADMIGDTINKAAQNVENVINSARTQLKTKYEAFKKGTDYLVSYTKRTLEQSGEKGIALLRRFGNKVARGFGSYSSSVLCVDLARLADLQGKLRQLENYLGERTYQLTREANRVVSDVSRCYSEHYVQSQVRTIERTCEQVKERGDRISDMLQKKCIALQYALNHYQKVESLLCRDISIQAG